MTKQAPYQDYIVKKYAGSEIFLYFEINKSACHSFTDAARRHQTPSLERETLSGRAMGIRGGLESFVQVCRPWFSGRRMQEACSLVGASGCVLGEGSWI